MKIIARLLRLGELRAARDALRVAADRIAKLRDQVRRLGAEPEA